MQPRFVTSHRHPQAGRRARRPRRRVGQRKTTGRMRLAKTNASQPVFMIAAAAQPHTAWLN